ncbi:MAG: S41 family peptidase, partial [Candidatus Aminicenantales bacterium]
MKRRGFFFFILFFTLVSFPAWEEDVWTQSMGKLSQMVSLIDQNYYKNVDHEELAFSSIKGMLQTLDPHSYFLDPRHFDRVREEYKGKYYGLGILIQKQGKRLVVISPIEGGPSYRLGIRSGDVISHINGEPTEPISSTEAMMRLRGRKGTQVTITARVRDSDGVANVTLHYKPVLPGQYIPKTSINFAGWTAIAMRDD